MADFSNFELAGAVEGRGVYDYADGLLPEMASVFEVDLGDEPNAEAIGQLVGAIGKSKALRENVAQVQEVLGTDQDGLTIAANWLERSGVQRPLDRSLWTPEQQTPRNLASIVLTGAVANWQDRTAQLLETRAQDKKTITQVLYPVGNRTMDTGTEVVNPNVVAFQEAQGALPTEAQYAADVIAPRLRSSGYDVTVVPYNTKDGNEIAAKFAEDYHYLFGSRLAFARVANAGIQLAVQFRQAIRQQEAGFDNGAHDPKVFVLTDTFPIARTEDEAKNAKEFQNPLTGIRQIAVTAKSLVEAAQN